MTSVIPPSADLLVYEPLRHGQAPPSASGSVATSSIPEDQAQAVETHGTEPRAACSRGGQHGRVPVPQQQDRLACETTAAWSPASPSSLLELPASVWDVVEASCELRMTADISNNDIQDSNHKQLSSASYNRRNIAPDTTAHMIAASPFELDRDMMGMLANNWNLSGPQRAAPANWGFEPTPEEAQAALYDADALMDGSLSTPGGNQQGMTGSMLMNGVAGAAMASMLELAGTEPTFPSNGMDNNVPVQQSMGVAATQGPAPGSFQGMDPGFVMPYQDCASLPVGNYPLYDAPSSGLFLPTFDGPVTSTSDSTDLSGYSTAAAQAAGNQLGDASSPYFPANGSQPMLGGGAPPSFQGGMGNSNASINGSSIFDQVTALNTGFVMPDSVLKEEDETNSDWNGSSSGFSTMSSSPAAKNTDPAMSSSMEGARAKASVGDRDGQQPKKPKRIRRLCSIEGCGKRARSQDLCIAHGGGRRCIVEGCEKSSQGGNMCIKHGGGKRCRHPGCDKAAQTNSLCKAHGGGPRCQFRGCTKSSQGGGFCRAHGGGKRCAAEGCNKGTQRGDFCALHGGSRFCEVPGCMRNDRGGGFCAHHGGGKRCYIANCNRSCRRNGLCSTHLRLLGHETGGIAAAASGDVTDGMPSAASSSESII